VGGGATFLHYADAGNGALIEFHRSTFALHLLANVGFSVAPDPPGKVPGQKRVRFEASDNVFDMRMGMLQSELMGKFAEKEKWQKPGDAEAVFMPQVGWAEKRNVYSSGSAEVYWSPGRDQSLRIAPGGLKDWQRRWNLTDASSLEGPIRFDGGDLRFKAAAAPEKFTPADFRLRPDSAGHRAGKDGKDLGADVDLVGPGAAYERWKQTPEYQQWLNETGQQAVAARLDDDVARRELAKWQGEWENPDYGRLIIKGDRWSWYPKDGPEVVSTIKIVEVADKMTHVLLLNTGLDGKVRTIQTILRVEDDTLHNCGTIGNVRPTEFAEKPGYLYAKWKRVVKTPP
jgi:hypothetical protein